MTARATRNQGKSMFVKEILNSNPQANHQAVNEAWRAEGMSGTISPTLVSRMRSRLGLAGKRRKRRRGGAATTAAGAGATGSVKSRGRMSSLMELEVEIDRLLMKVAEIGTLPEVEDSLRKTRRQLYAGLEARA